MKNIQKLTLKALEKWIAKTTAEKNAVKTAKPLVYGVYTHRAINNSARLEHYYPTEK